MSLSNREQAFQKLEAFVKSSGMKQSRSRSLILESIFGFRHHFTAQELVREVERKHPKIGMATVYRNLPLFVQAGLLRESLINADGQLVFEIEDGKHHDYLVCADCGRIFEFHSDVIEQEQQRVLQERGFRELRHRHVIFGSCTRQPVCPDRAQAGSQ